MSIPTAERDKNDPPPQDFLDSDDSDFDSVSTDWSDSTEASGDAISKSEDEPLRTDVELSAEFLDLINPNTHGMRLADGTACTPSRVISALDIDGTLLRSLSEKLKLAGDSVDVYKCMHPEALRQHETIRHVVGKGLCALADMARGCHQKVSLRHIVAADMLTPRAATALRHLREMHRSKYIGHRQVYWAMGLWIRTDRRFSPELGELLPRASKCKEPPTLDYGTSGSGRARLSATTVATAKLYLSLMELLMEPATSRLLRDVMFALDETSEVSVGGVEVRESAEGRRRRSQGVIVGPVVLTTNYYGDAIAARVATHSVEGRTATGSHISTKKLPRSYSGQSMGFMLYVLVAKWACRRTPREFDDFVLAEFGCDDS